MASSLVEQIALDDLGDGRFRSRFRPEPMGNTQPIAFGGCTIAIALKAACETVPHGYNVYSAQGNFLGPAQNNQKYDISVHSYRHTKSFATRRVEVGQAQGDGQLRLCMVVVVDFHVHEKHALLNYARTASHSFGSIEDALPTAQLRELLVRQGKMSQRAADAHAKNFSLQHRFFDVRHDRGGVGGQNLFGAAKHLPTTQDDFELTDKTSMQWVKCKHPVEAHGDHVAALGFFLDIALAFIPLVHNKMYLDDTGACSTLEFSLRLLGSHVNVNEWFLRELRSIAGGNARTFSESQVWDMSGNMVASMTQQSILRPKL